VFLHIEETDDINHKCNPKNTMMLSRRSTGAVALREALRECHVALLLDQGASSVTGEHMRLKVPYAVRGGRGKGAEATLPREWREERSLGKLLVSILED
jgi:hypothetical protein